MSWRVDLWQHLLLVRDRLTHRFVHRLRAVLGTWPGLLTLVLLLLTLSVGLVLWSHGSTPVSAKARTQSGLTQMATRTPAPRAVIAAAATVKAAAEVAATATQIANSPLLAPLPAQTATPNAAVSSASAAANASVTPAGIITTSVMGNVTPPVSSTVTVTPTTDIMLLLAPTPTPTPTQTILEALQQPVAPSGIAGIAATATAAAPVVEQAAPELPSVTEAEPVVEQAPTEAPTVTESEIDAPPPVPTIAIQPTPDGNVRTAYAPILMYHYLSVPPSDADAYRLDLSVTPELFAAQLDAMQQAGYTTISLYNLVDYLTQGAPELPEKPVIISFDDGYRDAYENALPLLRARSMTATFFIVTDFINDQRPEYLTWDMVREMYAAGMSIEGHGRNHVSLANKDTDYLVWQALGTYESIEHEIGVRPHFLSYPAGEYDQLTIDIFRSANYWAAVTTQQGATQRSDALFQLKRVRVHGTTSPDQLLNLLAQDW